MLARLEQEGLQPAPAASRETLVRRATLDLLGLPPTPAEVEAFVADESPDAYEKLIDRLLASPHYGERWGRHWLDVARYADSGGFETDIFFGHAWRYRDYVIRSFNADKPFDRFIKEQIAGDELYPGDARGAARDRPVHRSAPCCRKRAWSRASWSTTSSPTPSTRPARRSSGMTLGCARCHDHKYDPVSQKEYFGLQAIFAASDQVDFARRRHDEAARPGRAEEHAEGVRARAGPARASARRTRAARASTSAEIGDCVHRGRRGPRAAGVELTKGCQDMAQPLRAVQAGG